MAIIVRRKVREAKAPEGKHRAVITKAEEKPAVHTQYGVKDMVDFTFELESGEIVRQRFTLFLGRNSKLGKMVSSLLGELPDEVDLEEFVGTECIITVIHRVTESGDVWENVTDVAPVGGVF